MGGVSFSKDDLTIGLRNFDAQAVKAITIVLKYWSTRAASQMRAKASWTDRTGNARNGLRSQVIDNGDSATLVLYHSVNYGIWLEVRWSGRYAIIGPTIDDIGPQVMRMIGQAVLAASRPA